MSADASITAEDGWFVGERIPVLFPVKDDNGDPKNQTGMTLLYSFKTGPGGLTLFTKVPTVQTPADGEARIVIDPADTEDLSPASTYWHILERTDEPQVLASGDVVLRGK